MKKIIIVLVSLIILILGFFVYINFINNTKKEDKKVFNLECSNSNCKKEVKGVEEKNNSNSNVINSNSNIKSNSNIVSNKTSNSNVTSNTTKTSNTTVKSNTTSNMKNRNDSNKTSNIDVDTSNSNSNINESSNIPSNIEDENGKLVAYDTVDVWSQQEELKIFDVDKIKPGDSGIYEFEVNNNSDESKKYMMVFDEINEYKANVMYKLKRNDEYIAGNSSTWVKYNKLNFDEQVLNKNEKDQYTIEWKWVDAENDTDVGRNFEATYTLKISIQAYEKKDIEKQVKGASENPLTLDNLKLYIGLFIISFISIIKLSKLYRKNNI